ncbi:hypothetical protein FF38_05737 [Lucilia cuprina]|uniref:DNA/RNA non-specific endonuclease/pyrophosphatase/phosphodiesterase domain-containing protein n=1 Tax=Lucilia cuprina TaxID=7375 RepID=A0A0L0C8F8_LUCCU|nr:hypothetical protein CVS40_7072 [Lucilia cuprina]KNC28512.1 hypothetical protein FF38_05737 [Lucilia cuprina]
MEEEELTDIVEIPRSGNINNAGCSLSLRNDLKNAKMPLLITPGTTLFYPYDENGFINVNFNRAIELVCTRGFANPDQPTTTITFAFCIRGQMFNITNSSMDLGTVACTGWNDVTVANLSNSCNGGTKFLDVGFQLAPMRFASVYQVCFNEEYEVTRYVQHTLYKGANNYQNSERPNKFLKAGFFGGEELDVIYTKQTQRVLLNRILGQDSTKYFNDNNYYLSKGHLAAKADFVYASQQRTTFLYINTAPQWQSFNGGNWLAVENGLRQWVDTKKRDLLCWTGVYGVTSLTGEMMTDVELFLYEDNDKHFHLPIPKLFFRVAVEPISKLGVVLVGVNNPHVSLDVIKRSYVLCEDVSHKISYINWKRLDLKNGYSYACEVNEFRKVVTHLPTFDVRGLLV